MAWEQFDVLEKTAELPNEEAVHELLEVINYQYQNVLTTEQLAKAYGSKATNIQTNHAANQEKFIKNEDYFLHEGAEFEKFKGIHLNEESLKFVINFIFGQNVELINIANFSILKKHGNNLMYC